MNNPPILSIDHATVRHLSKTLFKDLGFKIEQGQQWAFLGKSGSGKTALLHTIYGDFNVIKGKRQYPQFKAFKTQKEIKDPLFTNKKLMAFVEQQAHFKNKENIAGGFFYQQRYHSTFSEEAATVETYLQEEEEKMEVNANLPIKFSLPWVKDHLLLNDLLDKTLIQLSNGETRRLMIASALLEQPMLLLMDNPFIGLDQASRPLLEQILDKIVETGTHIIMATTPREIPECITHIALLENQTLKNTGPRAEFKDQLELLTQKSNWQPDPTILSKIDTQKPTQNDNFETALKMVDIHVHSRDKVILDKVNWQVDKGDKWSLLGANGAGKSTLLSLMNGDHPQAYANTIYLFDHKRGSGESIWEIKRRIGFVSPEMHQYFKARHKIIDVILSDLDKTTKNQIENKSELAQLWLSLLNLNHLSGKLFRAISSGEQRLVLLIRAMIKNPPLLILDEPCQGLDAQQKEHFKRVVDALWDQDDKTILYVSHYKEDIPSCVTQILELDDGKVKA